MTAKTTDEIIREYLAALNMIPERIRPFDVIKYINEKLERRNANKRMILMLARGGLFRRFYLN